jgi:biopolymer transport protein ExbD
MNFRARQSDIDAEINLTPLIDVVFLLLIFFMVTTTFSKEAQIKLQLPEATSAVKTAVQGADDDEPRQLINTSHKTLQRTLAQAARNMVDPVVLIRADRLTPHEAVVKAMDAARQQGFYQITFSTANAE